MAGGTIFISYARPTARRAHAIARALEAQGWSPWIDDRLVSGRSFTDEIQQALEASDVVLVLWSEAAAASDWVRAEAGRAHEAGKLVQIRIDGSKLPLPFDQYHCLDFSRWRGTAKEPVWRALVESLAAAAANAAQHETRAPTHRSSLQLAGRGWAIGLVATVVLTVAAAGLGLWAWRGSHTAAREPRIALSAFTPVEPDPGTGAFAKRLTDEVAGVLGENAAGLAPPSADQAPPDADLRVGGSAQREGDTLRVRAFLEDGRAKVTLWSRQYERPVAEEEALRTQVAVELSDNTLNALEPFRQRGLKIDARALALWVSATATYRQGRTVGDPRVAARAYEQVVDRAPDFANARGMMAQSLVLASFFGASREEAASLRRRARAEAERAIRTDSTTAEGAYDALYFLARAESPGETARAEDEWISGLSRSPNLVGGLMRHCEILLDVGRARAALPDCERAVAQRPLGAPWGIRFARALAATGQEDRATQAIAREVRLHPQLFWIRQARFQMKAFSAPPAEALALLRDATQPPTFTAEEVPALEAFLRARMSGSRADADRAVTMLGSVVQHGGLNRAYLFQALVALGRLDDAAAFDLGVRGPFALQGGWLFAPGMQALQHDPRFWPLAARTGLIRYWRTRHVWPDFCSEPGLPFDCAAEAAKALPT